MSGAQFWRIVAPRGALVLRCWPIEHPTPERPAVHPCRARHAADRGMKILPVPIAASTGETFVQHARTPLGTRSLAARSRRLRTIARARKTPRRDDGARRVSRRGRRLSRSHAACVFARRHAPRSPTASLASANCKAAASNSLTPRSPTSTWPDLAPLAREFRRRAAARRPAAIARLAPLADVPLPLQPCIRDIWHDHVLFTGDASPA